MNIEESTPRQSPLLPKNSHSSYLLRIELPLQMNIHFEYSIVANMITKYHVFACELQNLTYDLYMLKKNPYLMLYFLFLWSLLVVPSYIRLLQTLPRRHLWFPILQQWNFKIIFHNIFRKIVINYNVLHVLVCKIFIITIRY
jgi:hypothetical protein